MYLVNRQGYFRSEVTNMDQKDHYEQLLEILANIILNYCYAQMQAEAEELDTGEAA